MSLRVRLGLGVVLILTFAMVFLIERATDVKPGAETESAFLKSYNPKEAIGAFLGGAGPEIARTIDSAGSFGFATHKEDFRMELAEDPVKFTALMEAMRKDAGERLKQSGARIVSDKEEAPAGFRIGYETGATRGAWIVKPDGLSRTEGRTKLVVTIEEMWSEAESGRRKKSGG